MMKLIGEKVLHQTLGEGTIIAAQINEENKGYITVEFSSKTPQFGFPKQFHDSHLTAVNPKLQEWIDSLKEPGPGPGPDPEQGPKPGPKHPIVRTFLVFQGSTYDEEKAGEFIWAPIANLNGRSHHSWERLTRVREGDIIVHVCKGYIRAFSRACGSCYESRNPFGGSNPWDRMGRRIECEYLSLYYLLRTIDYADIISQCCKSMSYSPFRSDGKGNMGYLFDLPSDLTRTFLKEAIRRNPHLEKVGWIHDFLQD